MAMSAEAVPVEEPVEATAVRVGSVTPSRTTVRDDAAPERAVRGASKCPFRAKTRTCFAAACVFFAALVGAIAAVTAHSRRERKGKLVGQYDTQSSIPGPAASSERSGPWCREEENNGEVVCWKILGKGLDGSRPDEGFAAVNSLLSWPTGRA
mmetsp:Transcript_44989/g.137407  ORF Transcript_44989/g.137407 Transcript_44989/m.137407 type:complete len:153 (-) Transcript_44989:37-495(-)